jgi:ubiquinone/menaquinone biosynthesis C-methylase UbiE
MPVADADGELTARQYDAMGEAYRAANDVRGVTAYYERPATIGLLGDIRGMRVLDAGCGPGALSRWLAGHGAIVTAVDISPEMVRIARDRLGDSAKVLLADLAGPLDFAADASTDLIVASRAMHYLADWDAPLAEFYRILAPGGAVVFSTHHPAADWQTHSPENYFAAIQVTETWYLGGQQPHQVTFWRRPLTAMTSAISQAGFIIDRLVEPMPLPGLQEREPAAYRRLTTTPGFLFFRLTKPTRTA